MAEELTLQVAEESEGERLDRFIAIAFPQYSREYLKKLILDGACTVQGVSAKKMKPSLILLEGQILTLNIPESIPLELLAEDLSLDVVYEDDQLLVVNKPSGMLTHPSAREKTGTLVNAVLFHCEGRLSGINGVERPGIVHRLDRETSGLLLIAKTDTAHRALQAQLQARDVKREYRAIVQGVLQFENGPDSGTVDAPIGRSSKNREKMAVVDIEDGRHAVTHWRVVANYHNRYSALELRLETGRTHQIRVHMAHIGHPIVGDPLYGTGLEKTQRIFEGGQVLQAFRLGFTHPVTQECLQFEIEPDDQYSRVVGVLTSLN